MFYTAALEMHPLDVEDRTGDLRGEQGIGFCNITKCCTKVCPEGITITDNAIIPLKERVVDDVFDPLANLLRFLRRDEWASPADSASLRSAGCPPGGGEDVRAQAPLPPSHPG